ncbi:MAG: hypothetical protein IRY97_11455 [Thermomicrobiaceae bacterium]|nr:hypothetical protein [Thermomicrobiaceae bacterium]
MTPDFEGWWRDPERRARLMAAAEAVEREPALLGLGPHLMAIARAGEAGAAEGNGPA